MSESSYRGEYDIIIIGGALSGSSTALLLKQLQPQLSILIVERSEEFKRRVGESTVEISSYFLGKTLGLTDYLTEHHQIKQGLRFWFFNKATDDLDSSSEIGPHYNIRFPSYQVDRALLDEHLLSLCIKAGVEVMRPAEVKDFAFHRGDQQLVKVNYEGAQIELSSRWVVDASGMAKFIARKHSLIRKNEEHPIAAAWARWSGVKSWDCPKLRAQYPQFANRTYANRNTATNHLVGKGWWSWWIVLRGGDVSVGVVYDERITAPPEGDKPADRLKSLLHEHPIAKILLEDATIIEGDTHWRKNFTYSSKRIVDDGFAIVGDAAGFIDPFYSPGMDWISFTAYATAQLISKERTGCISADEVNYQNTLFVNSYQNWFEAIYKDKYYYMGDAELMNIAFNLDLGLYYIGIVSQPFKYGEKSLAIPPLSGPKTRFPLWLIKTYNRRLVSIAKKRMERGTWGSKNNNHYYSFVSFGLDKTLYHRVFKSLLRWLALELKEGWRSWSWNSLTPIRSKKE